MGALFGSKPQASPATPMPVPDDAAALAAQARQKQLIASRSGRASTVMSRASGTGEAGTTSYGNSLLGSAG